jgi:hypothetical protein
VTALRQPRDLAAVDSPAGAGSADSVVVPPGVLPEWGAGAIEGPPSGGRLLEGLGRITDAQRAALRDSWQALWSSRAVVWLAGTGTVALLGFGPSRKVLQHAQLTRGFGAVGNYLLAPAARWDAAWYLLIARSGYGPNLGSATTARSAFYPLYPLAVRTVSAFSPAPVVAALLVSLLSLGAALYLLHRLTALEVQAGAILKGARLQAVGAGDRPREVARLAVLIVAFSPMAFFFSAVYSESLYLALSIAVFWFARRGRWALVGAFGALAGATRPTGVLLLIPALLLYLYGPREEMEPALPPDRPHGFRLRRPLSLAGVGSLANSLRPRYRPRRDLLWLGLMPAGLLVFMAYLGLAGGDPMAPFSAQQLWGREFAGPFVGLWDGAVAGFDGLRQLLSVQDHHAYLAQASGSPLVSASHNLPLFIFALGALVATVGVFRALPPAYGAYMILALALPLSYPVSGEPLMSLPRFLLVLFPISMWLAGWLAARPRARIPVLACSATLMAFFTGAFATWHWVS